MAPNSVLLPVSEPPPPLRAGDESAPIFRESSMSRRGAFAALSYMSCAGPCFLHQLLLPFPLLECFFHDFCFLLIFEEGFRYFSLISSLLRWFCFSLLVLTMQQDWKLNPFDYLLEHVTCTSALRF